MELSHRGGIILLLLVGLVAVHIWSSGKLGRAWAAIQGSGNAGTPPAPTSVGAATGGAGGTGPAPSGAAPSGNLAALFGVTGTFSGYGEGLGNVGTLDQQGLSAVGGGTLAHDADYGATPYQPVSLPTTATFLGNSKGIWGNLLYFRLPSGGVFGLPHLEQLANLVPGTSYGAGTLLGVVGGGPYSSSVWTGPHLSIITDTSAWKTLTDLVKGIAGA